MGHCLVGIIVICPFALQGQGICWIWHSFQRAAELWYFLSCLEFVRGPFRPNASLPGFIFYITVSHVNNAFVFFQGPSRSSTWFLRPQFWVVTSTSISTFRTGCSFGKKRSAETKRYSKSGTWDVDSQIISNLRWVIHGVFSLKLFFTVVSCKNEKVSLNESCLFSFLFPSKKRSTGGRMAASRKLSFWWKILTLIGHYSIKYMICQGCVKKVKSHLKKRVSVDVVHPELAFLRRQAKKELHAKVEDLFSKNFINLKKRFG